mmetsp:Transcript_14563/g.17996  ORF Transcript_14563/g.17996 Transcript_14563/m.17996 type:complete len:86 (-) Transcript_14563:1193-1450(-)
MGERARKDNARFVVAVGDNMYNLGVRDENDPQLTEKFNNTFTDESLLVPWYLCGGNIIIMETQLAKSSIRRKKSKVAFPNILFCG